MKKGHLCIGPFKKYIHHLGRDLIFGYVSVEIIINAFSCADDPTSKMITLLPAMLACLCPCILFFQQELKPPFSIHCECGNFACQIKRTVKGYTLEKIKF